MLNTIDTNNSQPCVAVPSVLAQRALDDGASISRWQEKVTGSVHINFACRAADHGIHADGMLARETHLEWVMQPSAPGCA